MRLGERGNVGIEAIPTGALALDLALGIGGLPRGRIVEIFGPESSGKSTLAMHVVAEAQRNGGVCAYIDAEHATPCLMTANFACRRSVFQEAGGFAVDYLRDEDREFQLRLWSAGRRGLFVHDVKVTTEVPADRLTKAYHRQFYARVGESHARMRYLDSIDGDGRLLRAAPSRATLLGTPAFIYRYLLTHVVRMAWMTATLRGDRAFYHETRARYYARFIATRRRAEAHSIRAVPAGVARILGRLVQRGVSTMVFTALRDRRMRRRERSIRT
jgi:hypothetical protein